MHASYLPQASYYYMSRVEPRTTHRRPQPSFSPRDVDRYQDVDGYYPRRRASMSSAVSSDMPPPPPYEEIDTTWTRSSPGRPPGQETWQTETVPHEPYPRRLRKKASAWMSSLDLSRAHQRREGESEPISPSRVNLAIRTNDAAADEGMMVQSMNQSAALCDRVAARLTDVFSRSGEDEVEDARRRGHDRTRELGLDHEQSRGGIIDFKKTWLYANSRLPPHMLPMRIYLDTWRIVCLAAQASLDAYRRPRRGEKEDYIEADWRSGTKAMVIKSRPVDDMNLIVIAIRGSRKNLVDWSVNFGLTPTEPRGFLDDEGNACHAGFLQVARKMIAPVAARLLSLLSQNSSRPPPSLLLTGHSAGGAVASLLYMHMLATRVGESPLNLLTGFFKRVHCVTFGVPPLSLLPLQKPAGRRFEHSVFFAFANEGDVIVRADRQYLSTIARLIAAPAPVKVSKTARPGSAQQQQHVQAPWWAVPPATLSLPGTVMLLREKPGRKHVIEAVHVTDDDLRNVVFGDPAMHPMELYKSRIDDLAAAAITGRTVS